MNVIIMTAAILEERNKYLIVRPEKSSIWEFPGGRVQPGEDPEVALIRNAQEQLAIDIAPLDIFKVASHAEGQQQEVILAYLCIRNFGEPQPSGAEEVLWVTLDELRSGVYDFSDQHKIMINKISIFSGCGPSLLN